MAQLLGRSWHEALRAIARRSLAATAAWLAALSSGRAPSRRGDPNAGAIALGEGWWLGALEQAASVAARQLAALGPMHWPPRARCSGPLYPWRGRPTCSAGLEAMTPCHGPLAKHLA